MWWLKIYNKSTGVTTEVVTDDFSGVYDEIYNAYYDSEIHNQLVKCEYGVC
jgi:hypothetical protein